MYVRAKDTAHVASDLVLTIFNNTDSTYVVSDAFKTLTASYAWYSTDFSIATDDSGDTIRFQTSKNTGTGNTIIFDVVADP